MYWVPQILSCDLPYAPCCVLRVLCIVGRALRSWVFRMFRTLRTFLRTFRTLRAFSPPYAGRCPFNKKPFLLSISPNIYIAVTSALDIQDHFSTKYPQLPLWDVLALSTTAARMSGWALFLGLEICGMVFWMAAGGGCVVIVPLFSLQSARLTRTH